ncbi:unnamed protein product, partial [Allacma fusca]
MENHNDQFHINWAELFEREPFIESELNGRSNNGEIASVPDVQGNEMEDELPGSDSKAGD